MKDRIGYAEHFENCLPYPGGRPVPKFFAQILDLGENYVASINPETGRLENVYRPYAPGTPLEVVGWSVYHATDPNDAKIERAEFDRNGRFMAWCFSRIEPRGELGFVPLDGRIRAINEAELVNALKAFGNDV